MATSFEKVKKLNSTNLYYLYSRWRHYSFVCPTFIPYIGKDDFWLDKKTLNQSEASFYPADTRRSFRHMSNTWLVLRVNLEGCLNRCHYMSIVTALCLNLNLFISLKVDPPQNKNENSIYNYRYSGDHTRDTTKVSVHSFWFSQSDWV